MKFLVIRFQTRKANGKWIMYIDLSQVGNRKNNLRNIFLITGELQVILDRRLYQDDNRGLGQGVTDNKVTPANFRLVLEKFKTANEPVSTVFVG